MIIIYVIYQKLINSPPNMLFLQIHIFILIKQAMQVSLCLNCFSNKIISFINKQVFHSNPTMDEQHKHKRNRSTFSRGMTLEDYLRSMEIQEDTIPTADTHKQFEEPQLAQQNLYRTSHQFYNPDHRLKENFQDSLEQCRDSINIISNQLQARKDPVIRQSSKKGYRIRQSSPYSCGKRQSDFSPYKTFMKKLETSKKHENYDIQPQFKKKHLGNSNQLKASTRNVRVDKLDLICQDRHPEKPKIEQLPKKLEKMEFRVENLKQRLQQKRKMKHRS